MRVTLALAWLLVGAFSAYAAGPAQISTSIVQVTPQGCVDAAGNIVRKSGTGFFYGNNMQVVTALHVIAGCKFVSVRSEKLGQSDATIAHVEREADLALLALPKPLDALPLQESQRQPQPDDILKVFGYAFGAPTWTNQELKVALNQSNLRNMLPYEIARKLDTLKSPSPEISILRLNGPLYSGLSGAPIVDATGNIVGVGDGGLDGGAIQISWAVQRSYLSKLLASKDHDAPATPGMDSLSTFYEAPFFSSSGATNAVKRNCGRLDFYKIGKRSLSELLLTADDRAGAEKIMRAFGVNKEQANASEYDIWQEPISGASIAVPTEFDNPRSIINCEIVLGLSDIEFNFGGYKMLNMADAAAMRAKLEWGWLEAAEKIRPDKADGYDDAVSEAPSAGSDTKIERRSLNTYPNNVGIAAETVFSRGTVLAGATLAAINYNRDEALQCSKKTELSEYCEKQLKVMSELAKFLLGLRVSTLPPT